MDHAVKFVDGHDDLIEGMLAPFGGRDSQGEHFTPETNFELEWFGDWERPVLYKHGKDPAIKTSVVGRMKVTPTDKGLWVQAQLDESHAYKEAIAELVNEGALGFSAGSIERFYFAGRNTKTGAIKHFPLIEGSLVTMPSHPEALPAPYATKDAAEHLAVLGVAVPDELADIPTEPEKDALPASEADVEPATKNVEPVTKADLDEIHEAIKSLTAAVNALTSPSDEAVDPPALAIAINGAEKEDPFDPEAFARELAEHAVKTAKDIISG